VHSALPSGVLVIAVHVLADKQASQRARCAAAHSSNEP
jgi:hypothetical protein